MAVWGSPYPEQMLALQLTEGRDEASIWCADDDAFNRSTLGEHFESSFSAPWQGKQPYHAPAVVACALTLHQLQLNLLRCCIQPHDSKLPNLPCPRAFRLGLVHGSATLPACLQHRTQGGQIRLRGCRTDRKST